MNLYHFFGGKQLGTGSLSRIDRRLLSGLLR